MCIFLRVHCFEASSLNFLRESELSWKKRERERERKRERKQWRNNGKSDWRNSVSFFGVRRRRSRRRRGRKDMERKRKSMIYTANDNNNKRNNPYSLTYIHIQTQTHIFVHDIWNKRRKQYYYKQRTQHKWKEIHTHTPASEAKKARVTNFVVSRKKN